MIFSGGRRVPGFAVVGVVLLIGAALLFGVAVLGALAGCTSAVRSAGCIDDRGCPGGACIWGQCRGMYGADLGPPDELWPDGPIGSDDGGESGGIDGGGITALCNPNHDGVIDRSEAKVIVGIGPGYAVNTPGSTTPVNMMEQAGVWDFSAPPDFQGGSEIQAFDQLMSAKNQWWSADFPTADYAMRAQDGQDLLIVAHSAADREEALGYVSQSNQATELKYDHPIPLWIFPMKVGDQWSATATLSGRIDYVVALESETWNMTVEARGTTRVPLGSFDTLRLRIDFSQTLGLVRTTHFLYQHVAECYGQIARIRSKDNETSPNFTTAAELRRLALP